MCSGTTRLPLQSKRRRGNVGGCLLICASRCKWQLWRPLLHSRANPLLFKWCFTKTNAEAAGGLAVLSSSPTLPLAAGSPRRGSPPWFSSRNLLSPHAAASWCQSCHSPEHRGSCPQLPEFSLLSFGTTLQPLAL